MTHCESTWNGKRLPHHLHNNGGNTNTKTLEINIGGKCDGYRLFQSHSGFFHRVRVQTLANVVHAKGSEDRTPLRTHIFLSIAHLITDHHTHLRSAQVWDVLHFCAS